MKTRKGVHDAPRRITFTSELYRAARLTATGSAIRTGKAPKVPTR